ncbi:MULTISPECIES: hypothetical protein [unclassified Janthinobacterium]|uniref:hypothetical protein n=1 Tax=unclassified Janthinobacterium TaxID=2610881 RepID=UPI001E37DE95|nr:MULTISPECIES: hypothetical protein [unclassified Janthinobacterium]MCC7645987.1 hypothetical protein [Janthinobacterium sp. EB271-G4-3-1]MCC7694652.1 hypothetical protein [Janthinobacterium sp. EB271-G4-3-2]
MKNALTFLVLGAALSACGGGSDGGTPEAPVTPPVVVTPVADPVTVASQAVAAQAGLAVIAGANGDETVYDVAADIGDTWRITFDSAKKTYAIRVLSTQFGLVDRSGTFSAVTAGHLTTYTGTDFSVTVDARTRLLTGTVKLGSMHSNVSGSGYAVTDVARLAGSYIFLGTMRNASNGGDRFNPKGSLKVAADGSAQLCNGGVFNAQGVCSAVSPQLEAENASLTLVRDAARGLIIARQGDQDFGIVHAHAGDRGLALFIDRYSRNQQNVLRVGTIVAAKQQKISTEIAGSYACAAPGISAKIVVAGSTATITNNTAGKTHAETITINKLGLGAQAVDFDGIAVFKDPADVPADYSMFMPVSSSMAVEFSTDRSYMGTCLKN